MTGNKDEVLKIKPWAVKVLGDGELLYACPKCTMRFFMFKSDEKYCHNCGCAIDWNVTLCSGAIKTEKDLIALNKAQKPAEFARYYKESGEPKTCKDCGHYKDGCTVPASLKWSDMKVASLTGGENTVLCDVFKAK